ncbi:MAG: hypothetical protein ACR2GG_09435, partial [Gemmatimonadaceae bacterium]
MMRFIQWPWALALALILPALAAAGLVMGRKSRAKRLTQLGTRTMLARLAPQTSRRGAWHVARIVTALALIGV